MTNATTVTSGKKYPKIGSPESIARHQQRVSQQDSDAFDYIWSTAVVGSEAGDPDWNVNVLCARIRAASAKREQEKKNA